MLKFCYGSDLSILGEQLVSEFEENKLSEPLEPEIFVVQNYGMGRWLSMYLAKEKGIAANLKFEFPAERIWSLYRHIDPDIPKTLPSDRQPLAFSIMHLLNRMEKEPVFDPLWRYIRKESADIQQLRIWKLSNRIADVFDQYLVYRPEMLVSWQDEKLTTNNPSERWQAALWRKLTGHWKQDNGNEEKRWTHRGELHEKLLSYIDEKEMKIADLPERITIFGVSTLPPAFIKTFVKLSKLTDVRFYWLAPVDGKTPENNLVESMGKEGIEFLSNFEYEVKQDAEVVSNHQKVFVSGRPEYSDSLLSQIQYDIINNKKGTAVTEADRSIQLHSCHSAMREVEVLHDQLMALFDKNPDLPPDEIVIMMPDIETYAPLIDAVFGTDEEDVPHIPFSIADRGFRSESPVAVTFIKIMNLLQSRFKVTDVMELLESEILRRSLEISEDEFTLLQQWIHDNRIRWGIDSKFRGDNNLPANDHFSWKKGISRILLGYAMQSDGEQAYRDQIPYSYIEGTSQAELAGKLSSFLHKLFDFYDRAGHSKKAEGWHRFCSDMLQEFFPDNRDTHHEISQIRRQLDKLMEYTDVSNFDIPVSFNVIHSFIEELLDNHQTGGGFMGHGITFCALVPMRSIPFKVIGILGMDEDAFPRNHKPVEFDLMRLHPRPGDRSRADDDRYMFLETLLSAKENLIISYIGQSNIQDTSFPPSVVVSELLNVLEDEYEIKADDITTRHRLQAFSPRYFNGDDPDLFSYAGSQLRISRRIDAGDDESDSFITDPLPVPDDDWQTISLGELISFYQHPVRFFMQQRLGLYLQKTDALTEEREPFETDGLSRYHIRQEMLERFLKGNELDSYRNIAAAGDLLPVGFPGDQSFIQQKREAEEFGRELTEILDRQAKPDIEIDLNLDAFHLTGKLTSLYENGQWLHRFGSMRGKDRVELWIKHLTYLAGKPSGYQPVSHMVTKSGSIEQEMIGNIRDAQKILMKLLNYYRQGLQKPLMFFPDTSYTYACRIIENEKEPYSAARSALYSGWYNPYTPAPCDGDDSYNSFFMRGKDPTTEPFFRNLALDFWQPYLAAKKEDS